MKRVAIIVKADKSADDLKYLTDTLESVFGEYIEIVICYIDDLLTGKTTTADACLLANDYMFSMIKDYISELGIVIKLNRSINNAALPQIRNIPAGSRVLVVNDCYSSSVQTAYALYDLDIENIYFVPYDVDEKNQSIYDDFHIAVTANEEDLVPSHIKNVINIGDRAISFDTLARLMKALNFNSNIINRNLLKHIKTISEANINFKNTYIDSYFKSEILNSIANETTASILITDYNYNLIYANDRACELLRLNEYFLKPISDYLYDETVQILKSEICPKDFIDIFSEKYTVEKLKVTVLDEIIGYYIALRSEKDLRDVEINAKKNLKAKSLYAKYSFSDIIHKSKIMNECISMAKTASLTDYTILINGDSGTGKELIAQSIHNFSQRNAMPFVAINCAALPESLLESELFGYEGGAFTGAKKNGKIGLFEQANGGTIFLDEIGDISLQMQSSLLRVLQEKQIMRLGDDHLITIDTRIIAATNRNLYDEVKNGRFRKDLYYRLNVINLKIPALCERKDDIPVLLKHLMGAAYDSLTEDELSLLLSYDWPGNIRELENASMYYSTLCSLPPLLKENMARERLTHKTFPSKRDSTGNTYADIDKIQFEILKIIADNSHTFHGIGRSSLNNKLADFGLHIGDSNLRKILKSLEEKELISIGKGRTGTKITEKGREKI